MKIIKLSNNEITTSNLSEIKSKIEQKKGKWYHFEKICVFKTKDTKEYGLVSFNIFDRLALPFRGDKVQGRKVKYVSSKEFKSKLIDQINIKFNCVFKMAEDQNFAKWFSLGEGDMGAKVVNLLPKDLFSSIHVRKNGEDTRAILLQPTRLVFPKLPKNIPNIPDLENIAKYLNGEVSEAQKDFEAVAKLQASLLITVNKDQDKVIKAHVSLIKDPNKVSPTKKIDQAESLIAEVNQAEKTLIDETKKAAKGELFATCIPNGTSYEKFHRMIDNASLEQIPYMIQGVGSSLLPRLLKNRERNNNELNQKKLKLAIQLLHESTLVDYVNSNKEWLQMQDKTGVERFNQHFFNWHLFDTINDQGLDILLKYKDELSLSGNIIKEIEEILKIKEDLYQATKNLPRLIFE